MKSTLFGFGIVYVLGALVLVFDVPLMPAKSLAVLAFLLPGVVALVASLEIARLRGQLDDLRGKA